MANSWGRHRSLGTTAPPETGKFECDGCHWTFSNKETFENHLTKCRVNADPLARAVEDQRAREKATGNG